MLIPFDPVVVVCSRLDATVSVPLEFGVQDQLLIIGKETML